MRILLVNRHFGGDQVPTGRMLKDLAIAYRDAGHEVSVLTAPSSYSAAERAADAIDGVRLRYLASIGEGARLLSWVVFLMQAFLIIPWLRFDRCILLTDPPFLVSAAIVANWFRRRKRPIYWWTMDLYPESLVAHGMLAEGGLPHRLLRALNVWALRHVTGVICLDHSQRRRLEQYSSWRPEQGYSMIVPPWDYRPMPRVERHQNRFLNQYGLAGHKVALYAGNLGQAHSYQELAAAARCLQSGGGDEWRLVFVARGALRPGLETEAGDLKNVVLLNYQPPEWTPDLLWAADVHLITMKAGWEGVVVPSKLYGVLQTDAPVLLIGPEDSGTAADVRRLGAGEVLPPGASGEAVAKSLERLGAATRASKLPAREEVADIVRFTT